MMCLLHQSEKYGVLTAEMEQKLPQLLGKDRRTLVRLLSEVEQKSILIRDVATGLLISKRMVRDEGLRQVRRRAGSLGGNPNLVKQKVKQTSNQKPTPSSSSSSSYITPLTPQGWNGGQKNENSETRKLLVKWLKTMPDVSSPNSMADYYLREWGEVIVRRALKNPLCVSRQELRELCEHYASSVEASKAPKNGNGVKNEHREPLKVRNFSSGP